MAATSRDMHGKVCLITGGTSGIGRATAFGLARLGARVVIVARDVDHLAETTRSILRETGNDAVEPIHANLMRRSEIRGLVKTFLGRHDKLDVLINNAGAIFAERMMTPEKFERTWALNHLAYFYLTLLLLGPLRAAGQARIVNVASAAHQRATLDFDNLQGERRFTPMSAYSRSKLANVMFTYALARRLAGSGVTANCLHPGAVATGFGHDTKGFFKLGLKIARLFFISPERGAVTPIFLAAAPEVVETSGRYFVKNVPAESSAASRDQAAQEHLWEVSVAQTGAAKLVP